MAQYFDADDTSATARMTSRQYSRDTIAFQRQKMRSPTGIGPDRHSRRDAPGRNRPAQTKAQHQTNNPADRLLTYRGRLGGRGAQGRDSAPATAAGERQARAGAGPWAEAHRAVLRSAALVLASAARQDRAAPGEDRVVVLETLREGGTSSRDGLAHTLQYGALL